MKNVINYFYNLYPEKLYENNGIYYFFISELKFYFLPLKRDLTELDSLVEVSNKLFNDGIMVHTFILSVNQTFSVNYNEFNYVLLRVNDIETDNLNLIDIMEFDNFVYSDKNTILYTEDWVSLWSKKIDTYEEQMIEFNKEFMLLTDSFNYYVGLAENAISYAKNAYLLYGSEDNSKLSLSHKRIYHPTTMGNIYNPLSFIFDYDIRDIAEYIKAKVINNKFDWDEAENLLTRFKFSNFKLNLLYARLLYPSYYFDLFEKIIYGEEREEDIKNIIKLSEYYERFLYEFFIVLKKYTPLAEIEWIVEKYS